MSVPYVKHQLGNKLFVIEWDLDPTQTPGLEGDPYTVQDARLVTLQALSSPNVELEILYSNFAAASGYERNLAINGSSYIDVEKNLMDPAPSTTEPLVLSQARSYRPRIAAVVSGAESRIALLFQAI